jgi:cobalamin biosynthesis Mg chelatase CobN
MKRVTLIATAMVLAVLVGLTARVAAQNTVPSERTFMTFSNTVEMPGVTLPAGTYVFRLADTPTRNVVQVLSQDEKDILGQWTFVQAQRPKATADTVVMFKEAPEGAKPAVQYWYYPGETIGKEFIYPKDQAQQIANRLGTSVLTEDGRVASTVASTDAQGNVTNWDREASATTSANANANAAEADSSLRNAPASAQPSAAAGSVAGNRGVSAEPDTSRDTAALNADASASQAPANRSVGTSGAGNAQATDVNRAQPESTQAQNELPRTASSAPLIGLIGLLALAGAVGTRRLAAVRR